MTIKLYHGIKQADAGRWDARAGDANPFVGHRFLSALEASGSATRRTGWMPLHLAYEEEGEPQAFVPLYLKSHSYGEYVFDHGWARAFEQAGGSYYPKLQVSVPFTPVPGPRLLVRPGEAGEADRDRLIEGLDAAMAQLEASSVHATFVSPEDVVAFERAGWLIRRGVQYHWVNRGYRDFADFLECMRSAKRKGIRKERGKVREQGVEVETLTGEAIRDEHWNAFWPFYLATVDKRWGSAYLTRDFFRRLGRDLAERVVLVMARHDGRYVGGALNLRGADTLYGRIWGCLEEFRFLHFEACYYAAIDFALAHGIARVEAGAQGTHKLQRGYEPVWTHSAHRINHPGLRDAVARFLKEEGRALDADMPELRALLPFREAADA